MKAYTCITRDILTKSKRSSNVMCYLRKTIRKNDMKVDEWIFYMDCVKRKRAFGHAQNAHTNHSAHAQSIIRAFALHSYIL